MNTTKGLNLLEQHVEKIVLAIAAAGAVYIGYIAFQPITISGDPTVNASNLEGKVSDAVADLNKARSNTKSLKDLTPHLENYVEKYSQLMFQQPLAPQLVSATNFPIFAPLQQPIVGGDVKDGGGQDFRVVTPSVPAPKELTAVASRAVVLVGPPGAPNPDGTPVSTPAPTTPGAPAVPVGPTRDENWVTVSGSIPLADFLAQMNDPSLKPTQRLSPQDQHAILYRIEVQRRQRNDGVWTEWKPLTPTRVSYNGVPDNGQPQSTIAYNPIDWARLTDTDLPTTVGALDASFKQIAEPDFYPLADGKPFIPAIIQRRVDEKKTAPTPGAPGALPPGAAPRLPVPVAAPRAEDEEAPTPQATIPGMPDLATLRQQPNVPFWFYDETVQPGQDYQYEVRLVFYNPTYRFPLGLAEPAMKDQPTIASAWSIIPGNVSINSDLYFFANAGLGSTQKITFRVYKWTYGHWYVGEWPAQPGSPVQGNIRLVDMVPSKSVPVETGYTLVDVNPATSGNDVSVVLLNPQGELITRSARADRTNPKRQELESQVVRPKVTAPTAATRPIHLPGSGPSSPDRNDE